MAIIPAIAAVTLCEESVDWNSSTMIETPLTGVTLCEESVDWNVKANTPRLAMMSLSARRVWIEIATVKISRNVRNVTLCEESVDWNLLVLVAYQADNVTLCEESVDWNTGDWTRAWKGLVSLSARRVWIEIRIVLINSIAVSMSLSARRVWIEIIQDLPKSTSFLSLSARRVWIEIWKESWREAAPYRHSLRGECGLKLHLSATPF